MNNNCIYLKQKINKNLECKKKNKLINIRECNNCQFKEYKSTINQKNCAKDTSKKQTLRNKSAKLTKLERNRFSVFTDDLEHCIVCEKKKEHLHEIFFGTNRQNSMRYGFVLPLCSSCHSEMHRNREWQDYWHKIGQKYWEKHIGTREKFIGMFGRCYIDNFAKRN